MRMVTRNALYVCWARSLAAACFVFALAACAPGPDGPGGSGGDAAHGPDPAERLTVNGTPVSLDALEAGLDDGELIEPGRPFVVRYPRAFTPAELRRLIRVVRDGVQGTAAGEVSIGPMRR